MFNVEKPIRVPVRHRLFQALHVKLTVNPFSEWPKVVNQMVQDLRPYFLIEEHVALPLKPYKFAVR